MLSVQHGCLLCCPCPHNPRHTFDRPPTLPPPLHRSCACLCATTTIQSRCTACREARWPPCCAAPSPSTTARFRRRDGKQQRMWGGTLVFYCCATHGLPLGPVLSRRTSSPNPAQSCRSAHRPASHPTPSPPPLAVTWCAWATTGTPICTRQHPAPTGSAACSRKRAMPACAAHGAPRVGLVAHMCSASACTRVGPPVLCSASCRPHPVPLPHILPPCALHPPSHPPPCFRLCFTLSP